MIEMKNNLKKFPTIAIICARGGSKGLKMKNLRELDGLPLIGRVIEHAKQANCIDTILVTTDDEDIAKVAKDYGAEVPFLRPSELSGDLSTTEETLKHALIEYEKISNKHFEIGVFLTATDIFRKPEWIRMSIDKLIDSPDLESVFIGMKTHKNFWEKQNDGSWSRVRDWMANYSSRQIRRSIVREDTGLCCASRAWLWREGRRIGDKVDIITNNDDFTGIDIHHLEDLMLAQAAIDIRKNIQDE